MEYLAQDTVTLFQSPDPANLYGYSPGIARIAGGRLVATIDVSGPGWEEYLEEPLWHRGELGWSWQGRVFLSDDGGATWRQTHAYPFMHARPVVAGTSIYVIGQAGDLVIIRSDDGGESWTEPSPLTTGQFWHQAPCNVHQAQGCVYLVMERRTRFDIETWYVGELAPVLMRGRIGEDLTMRENWTFASELSFQDVIPKVETLPDLQWHGIPFWKCPYPMGHETAPHRACAPIGWLETNVVQFTDPDHLWADPSGKTFHLWMRAHTGGSGYACIAKVTEQGEAPGTGDMITGLQEAPSGKTMLYVPCPGGQMKFHVLWDPQTRLFWLLSTQATDSMTRPDRLPEGRYNLPNNERRRLQLHFSKNMIDWCFAGLVCEGPSDNGARHYASMVIHREDLLVLSRSGDERAANAHNGNLITLHTIEKFRALAY